MNRSLFSGILVLVNLGLFAQDSLNIHHQVDSAPDFKYGIEVLYQMISKCYVCPETKEITGPMKLYMKVTVDSTGKVVLVEDATEKMDAYAREGIRVLMASADLWEAGWLKGKMVTSQIMIPITVTCGKNLRADWSRENMLTSQGDMLYEYGSKLKLTSSSDLALHFFKEANALLPWDIHIINEMAILEMKRGDTAEACKLYYHARDIGDGVAQQDIKNYCSHYPDTAQNELDWLPEDEPDEDMDTEALLNKFDSMPEFPGGARKLYEFLAKNINYPMEAKNQGIQGKVYVNFTLDIYGTPTNFKVLKSPHPIISQAAVTALRKMPNWILKTQGIEVPYMVPVDFHL